VELKGIGTERLWSMVPGAESAGPCPKPVQAMVPHGWRVPQEMHAK
jgi:hypothetical protein